MSTKSGLPSNQKQGNAKLSGPRAARAPEIIPTTAPATAPPTAPATAPPATPRKGGKRVPATKTQSTVYLLTDIMEEAKNAAYALLSTPAAPNGYSDLVNQAIEEKVAGLQDEFNQGKPFPPRGGALPTGPR
jgi:hypothetical protein